MIDEYNNKFIQAALHTAKVGRWLRLYQEIGSTNELAHHFIEREAAPDGSVVVAEYQMSGRGRMGRTWQAPPRSSILASFILRPTALVAARGFALTIALALAVQAAVRQLWPHLAVSLKWPNDVMLDELKCGGILSEVNVVNGQVAWAVLGLGLNVNVGAADLLTLPNATSLSIALGHEADRTVLFAAICNQLEPRYDALQSGGYPQLWQEWATSLCWLGRDVSLSNPQGQLALAGKLLGVDEDGAAVIATTHGEQRAHAGDLSLRLALLVFCAIITVPKHKPMFVDCYSKRNKDARLLAPQIAQAVQHARRCRGAQPCRT